MKVPSVVETATDILNLPVQVNGDTVVTLADVAEIRRSFKDRTSYARFNGQRAMYIEVKKRPDANVIKTSDAVLEIVAGGEPATPNKYPSAALVDFS